MYGRYWVVETMPPVSNSECTRVKPRPVSSEMGCWPMCPIRRMHVAPAVTAVEVPSHTTLLA
jgi:hypothetical protein